MWGQRCERGDCEAPQLRLVVGGAEPKMNGIPASLWGLYSPQRRSGGGGSRVKAAVGVPLS